MQDELEILDRLLTEIVSGGSVTPEAYDQQAIVFHLEAERIKKAFIREAFSLTKERYVERYIQFHQTAMVELIDRLVDYLDPAQLDTLTILSLHKSNTDLLKLLYRHLEDLLVYVERHFSKYFNPAAKSPESYRFMVHRELKRTVPEIRYALEKKSMNRQLLKVVLMPLDNFMEAIRAQEISYRRIMYLRELLSELTFLANNKLTGRRLDYKVCLSMGYLNYNASKFFGYCVREITALVQDQPTLSRQIEKLAFFLKIVNQHLVKPGFVYNEKGTSIRDQLSVWLGEELLFLEKRQQLSINFPLHANDPIQKDFRLQLNLSVAQFGCLLRGLKETGVIRNHNVMEVIKFFAAVAQTKNTETISWESLRTKFYSTDRASRDAVKEMASGVVAYLNNVRL